MGEVDHYDIDNAVSDEARERRRGDSDLRELIDMRVRELQEEIRELREQVRHLDDALSMVSS